MILVSFRIILPPCNAWIVSEKKKKKNTNVNEKQNINTNVTAVTL